MQILAHRGFWKQVKEKNKIASLMDAIERQWGIETDIRDYKGKLVISHDVATGASELVECFFEKYTSYGSDKLLALNVKADGIQSLLIEQLKKYGINNYAVFDMSIPEQVVYEKLGIKYFTRQSDYEIVPVMYEKAFGVWMDVWQEDWITSDIICEHLKNGKVVAIISPEIHGRDKNNLWNMLKRLSGENIWLCTDKPEEAEAFFGSCN